MSATVSALPPTSEPPLNRIPEPPVWLTGWSQLISNAVVILGAAFAVWQILELRADRARENAMQYVILLHQDPYAQVALDLSVAMQEGAVGDDRRLSLANVQRLGDLYLSAIACRNSGVCDRETIDIHFRSTVAGFYKLAYDNELVRLSCRLTDQPNRYGSLLRAYLIESGGAEASAVPVSSRRCE